MTNEETAAETSIAKDISALVQNLADEGRSRAQMMAMFAGALVGMLHGAPTLNGTQAIDQPLKLIARVCFDARVRESVRPN